MTLLSDIALGFAAFPLLMALVNLAVFRAPPRHTGRPPVSVLIPARNEEKNIADCVAAVLASADVDLELVVLDDHSTDGTAAILAAIPDPRLRVAKAPSLPPGWSGKQHACAALARCARHELMVFIDADVRLAPDALSRIAGYMARHDVGLASGFPRQITGSWSERLITPLIYSLLLGYLPMPLMQMFRAPAFGAGCGQLMVAWRAAYVRAGGHTAIRASLHDGVTLPRAFRAAGLMTGLFDATNLASCRMYTRPGEVWEGFGKNATEGMAKPVALPVWTVLLGGGHVLPFALLVIAPGAAAALAVCGSLGLRLLLGWRFRQPLASVPLHPLGVMALLLIQWSALLRAARGRPATWRGRIYPAQ